MSSSRQQYQDYRKQRGFLGQRRPQPTTSGAPAPDGAISSRRRLPYYLRRYIGSLRDFRGTIIALIAFGILSLAFNAVNPWTSKFMLDYVFSPSPAEPPSWLAPLIGDWSRQQLLVAVCGCLVLIALGEIVLHTVSEYFSRVLSAKMEVGIRRRLIRHLQVMALSKLERLKTGGIISRVEGDVDSYSRLLHEGLLGPINSLAMFGIGLGSLLFISPTVTLVCLAFIVLLATVAYGMFNIMRPLFRDLQEDRSRISGKLAETFGGIRVVRIFGREIAETLQFITAHNLLIRKQLHTERINIGIRRTMDSLSWGMDIAIWLVGGLAALDGKITLGDLIVFTRFTRWFFHPVFMMMHSLSNIQSSVACTERIFDLLDEPQDILDAPDAKPVSRLADRIAFRDVHFAYEKDKPVIRGLNLDIPVGKTVALVGPSGAGKTTITNLLVRFYDIDSGSLTLDGTDVRKLRLRDLRDLYSLVLQDVFLFDGTIAENIAYAVPDATEQQIRDAARIAAADEFIEQFPDRYQTLIGERGVKLSGGQKQRISLARAILKNPQILILDEATSSLDSQSEALIQNALRNILRNRTTIVIAHRLSTILDADLIAVVVDGAIAEQGTHQQLLELNGVYAQMYRRQTQKSADAPAFLKWDDHDGSDDDSQPHAAAHAAPPRHHGPFGPRPF